MEICAKYGYLLKIYIQVALYYDVLVIYNTIQSFSVCRFYDGIG